jgi:DNA-binding transcriptional LysR family regulator
MNTQALLARNRRHGVRLLHRTTHSVALTEEGDRLMETGRELRKSVDRIVSSLSEVAGARGGGQVRITAPASFARASILPRLPAFLRENPNLQIEIKFRNEILDLAAEGVDVAIRSASRPLARTPGEADVFAFVDRVRVA